jgi:rare lipoprotein A (peptidoglycan hydrolase)
VKFFSHFPTTTSLVLVVFLLGGCATRPPQLVIPPGAKDQKPEPLYTVVSTQTGKASYYSGRWIGRKTANGEIYRATDVTAAHKTLPFNTMVRVTNLRNGKEVIVRINNRGPYVRGRIIDLSLVAARQIEMTQAGVVPVKLEVLRKVPIQEKPNLKLPPREVKPLPTPGASPTPTTGKPKRTNR